jgi:hypothetical protein
MVLPSLASDKENAGQNRQAYLNEQLLRITENEVPVIEKTFSNLPAEDQQYLRGKCQDVFRKCFFYPGTPSAQELEYTRCKKLFKVLGIHPYGFTITG